MGRVSTPYGITRSRGVSKSRGPENLINYLKKIEDFDHPGGLEVTWRSSDLETSRWWFQTFLIFSPYLGKIPILTSIVFSNGLETTTTWEIIHAKCFLTDSQKLRTRQVSSLQGLKVTYIAAGEAAARTWQQIWLYIYICANMYIYLTVHIYTYIKDYIIICIYIFFLPGWKLWVLKYCSCKMGQL